MSGQSLNRSGDGGVPFSNPTTTQTSVAVGIQNVESNQQLTNVLATAQHIDYQQNPSPVVLSVRQYDNSIPAIYPDSNGQVGIYQQYTIPGRLPLSTNTPQTTYQQQNIVTLPPPTPPTPLTISPAFGPTSGNVRVTISGKNLTGASVTFGGVAATITVLNDTTIIATTPAGTGIATVVATSPSGTYYGTYTYITPLAIFTYTGANQTYVVPAGTTRLNALVSGSFGGIQNNICSFGYTINSSLAVTPGSTLQIVVGGKEPSLVYQSFYYAGSGRGNLNPVVGEFGGGFSAVLANADGYGFPTSISDIYLMSGGGGGMSGDVTIAGSGGLNKGVNGSPFSGSGGTTNPDGSGSGGAGGITDPANPFPGYAGFAGSQYQGGAKSGVYGGGGGGGYYGGGGGATTTLIGGGGGGSSYVGTATFVSGNADNSSTGYVILFPTVSTPIVPIAYQLSNDRNATLPSIYSSSIVLCKKVGDTNLYGVATSNMTFSLPFTLNSDTIISSPNTPGRVQINSNTYSII